MGNLSEAMQNLVGEINASADRRRVELSELGSNARNLMERFHLEHRDRAQTLKKELGETKKGLAKIASDVKQAGRIWREGFKKKSLRKS